MNKKLIGLYSGVAATFATAVPAVLAQTGGTVGQEDLFGGIGSEEFANQAGLGTADLPSTIASIIRTILGFLGIVAVVIILFGGFKWMTSGGNEDKVAEAKKLMISGVIGLVIVLSAFAIASFVITQIAGVAA
jgi:uncharacterized membrane protein YidH (DUF202 family)